MSINLDFLNQQLNQLKALGEQNQKLNTIFEQTISQILNDSPIEQKQEIIDVQNLAKESFKLAKEGNSDEAIKLTNELIKRYKNGR